MLVVLEGCAWLGCSPGLLPNRFIRLVVFIVWLCLCLPVCLIVCLIVCSVVDSQCCAVTICRLVGLLLSDLQVCLIDCLLVLLWVCLFDCFLLSLIVSSFARSL